MQPRSQGLFPYLGVELGVGREKDYAPSPAKGKGPGNEVVNSRCQFGEIGLVGAVCVATFFCIYFEIDKKKNFERTHLARVITDFVSFFVFNFRRALNG